MDHNETIAVPEHADAPETTAAGDPDAASGAGNLVPMFLAELARAMQAAAERERERIGAVVTDEAAAQVEKARARAATESDELRRLAEEDVDRIQVWSSTEIERIRREAKRRTEERRTDLEAYLAQHHTIATTEIDGVDSAVRDYRATLDQFFDELMGSTDPADIAGRAGSIPVLPDLDGVRAAARSAAVAELANAPQEAADELGSVADAPPEPAVVADAADEPSADGPSGPGVGLGVMDPEAVGRSHDVPDVLHPVNTDSSSDSVAVSVGESGDHSSAAVRLLRSIAPWTNSADHDRQDGSRPTH